MTRAIDVPVRRIALVGMMGTGKSTLAARVAATLGWTCIDVDALIEARTGRAISDIFATDGEAVFRVLEADVVADVLGDGFLGNGPRPVGAVVALGGGAVLTPSTRDRVADCDAVVWLHAQPAVLARRLAGDASRPLLAGDPLARLAALAAEREGIYRSVATHDIDVSELGLDDVVTRIVDIATVAASSHGERH